MHPAPDDARDRTAARAGLGVRRATGAGAVEERHRGRPGGGRPADRPELAPDVPVLPVSVHARRPASTRLRELVAPGRTLALLGRSGAGKSTLVNALAGTDVMPVQDDPPRGRQGAAHHRVPEPGPGARRRRGARHPGHPRRRPAGHRASGWTRPSRTSPSWPRTAGSATAGTTPSRAARCVAALARRVAAPRRLESWRKLRREVAVESARQAVRASAVASGRSRTTGSPDRRALAQFTGARGGRGRRGGGAGGSAAANRGVPEPRGRGSSSWAPTSAIWSLAVRRPDPALDQPERPGAGQQRRRPRLLPVRAGARRAGAVRTATTRSSPTG